MLTLMEQTVLYLVGEGNTDKSSARIMGVSEAAIADSVQRACRKLGARNRSQGAVMLRERYA